MIPSAAFRSCRPGAKASIHLSAIKVLGLQLLMDLKAVDVLTELIEVPECLADRSATVRLQHGANGIAHHEHGLDGWLVTILIEALYVCLGPPIGLWECQQLRSITLSEEFPESLT